MTGAKQEINSFYCLPENLSRIIKDDFVKAGLSDKMSFKHYLKLLHEEDDVTPEEVLDVIAGRNSEDGEVFSTADRLLESLHKNDGG